MILLNIGVDQAINTNVNIRVPSDTVVVGWYYYYVALRTHSLIRDCVLCPARDVLRKGSLSIIGVQFVWNLIQRQLTEINETKTETQCLELIDL